MIDAKLLATRGWDDGSAEVVVYGVWIPRHGDNVRLTIEVVDNQGTDLEVTILHKDYADSGDGTASGAYTVFDQVTGRRTLELLGAKELIRFALSLRRGGDLKDGQFGSVLIRFLEPVWFETVRT
jgi:hypothetical protein